MTGEDFSKSTILDLLNDEARKELNSDLNYGLPAWFNEISTKRIDEIKDEEVSRLIRQKILLRLAVKEASKRIEKNPLSGMYDGEMVEQLSKLDCEFWLKNLDLKENMAYILPNIDSSQFDWLSNEDEKEFFANLVILKDKTNK